LKGRSAVLGLCIEGRGQEGKCLNKADKVLTRMQSTDIEKIGRGEAIPGTDGGEKLAVGDRSQGSVATGIYYGDLVLLNMIVADEVKTSCFGVGNDAGSHAGVVASGPPEVEVLREGVGLRVVVIAQVVDGDDSAIGMDKR
jgi:hypothetical protein